MTIPAEKRRPRIRSHETGGHLPMAVVLTSTWGAGGRANAKVADHLVSVGLWSRTDDGYQIENCGAMKGGRR